KELGASDSTKFVLPLELTNLVAGLTAGAQSAMTATASAPPPAPADGAAPARRSPRRSSGG
ncbi:MAG: hypothetical protein ACYCZV_16240, partial [Acidimicrobiales bacterium]